jgi:hypothetical protein
LSYICPRIYLWIDLCCIYIISWMERLEESIEIGAAPVRGRWGGRKPSSKLESN